MDSVEPIHLLLGLLIFILSSVGGLALVGLVVVGLPADYFSASRSRGFMVGRHPTLRWAGVIVKNIAGMLLVAVGIVLAMPGVPGPGLLTIVVGVMLLDFPGKLRLERWLVSRPPILRTINGLRAKYKKPSLLMD